LPRLFSATPKLRCDSASADTMRLEILGSGVLIYVGMYSITQFSLKIEIDGVIVSGDGFSIYGNGALVMFPFKDSLRIYDAGEYPLYPSVIYSYLLD
jgi:hypothetical protein